MNKEQLAELDAVIAELKAHPEKHHQSAWMRSNQSQPALMTTPTLSCGSAFCIAGAVVARTGVQPQWYESTEYGQPTWRASLVIVNGETVGISEHAQILLGLDTFEANWLFDGANTMTRIEQIRDELARDYGLVG